MCPSRTLGCSLFVGTHSRNIQEKSYMLEWRVDPGCKWHAWPIMRDSDGDMNSAATQMTFLWLQNEAETRPKGSSEYGGSFNNPKLSHICIIRLHSNSRWEVIREVC